MDQSLSYVPDARVRQRARPVTALQTDDLVLNAGIELLARSGVDSTTPAAVSREAGLSITAVRQRFSSVDTFLYKIWKQKSLPIVLIPIFEAIQFFLECDQTSLSVAEDQLAGLLRQDSVTQATMELLCVSSHMPKLLTKIQKDLLATTFFSSSRDEIKTAQRTLMLDVALGMLARARNSRDLTKEIDEPELALLEGLRQPVTVTKLPEVDSSHLNIYPFQTGDEILNRLLNSCLQNSGRTGFGSVTTKQIAADAGVSEGMLFSRFPSKLELYTQATSIQTRMGFQDNLKFTNTLIEKFGQANANALFIREWSRPGLELQRSIYLEQLRLSWHVPEVRKAQETELQRLIESIEDSHTLPSEGDPDSESKIQLQLAIPTGAVFTAVLFPEAWKLPYSAITPTLP